MTDLQNIQFTFPITLLKRGMHQIVQCCDNVILYSVYLRALRMRGSISLTQKMQQAGEELGMFFGDPQKALEAGQSLYLEHRGNPTATIAAGIIQDYRNNHKDDFQLACLLAYAALRSLLQDKPYARTTKARIFAGMCGYPAPCKAATMMITNVQKKYRKRYHMDNVLRELKAHWGLTTFAQHTPYLFFGFEGTTLQQLILAHQQCKRPRTSRPLPPLSSEGHASIIAPHGSNATPLPSRQNANSTTSSSQHHLGHFTAPLQHHYSTISATVHQLILALAYMLNLLLYNVYPSKPAERYQYVKKRYQTASAGITSQFLHRCNI